MRPIGRKNLKLATLACTSLLSACVAFTAVAQELPKANQPEEVGFSSERLKRLTSVVQADIDKGEMRSNLLDLL